MSIDILTFGCRLNAFESEVMRGHAEAANLTDTIIVNTCAVTAEAERQARQAVRRAHRANPGADIIVTGCAAQIDPDSWRTIAGVTRVIGNVEKLTQAAWTATEPVLVADIMQVRQTAAHLIDGFGTRSRAFIEVQQGCDHRCTFCIIPYGRGPSRSIPMGAIADQIRTLVANGYQEIVLTGVDLTSYGADLPGTPKLGHLVRRLLAAIPELPRLRLSSIDPAEIDDDLWHVIEHEPRLMPHLHLSVQAGSDMILKRMKRRHLRHHVIEATSRARALRPGIAFGADLIAGFPTEDETMFNDSLRLIDEAGLDYLHVFPYSARNGTPAARIPALPMAERRARAARLRQAGERRAAARFKSMIGSTITALAESPANGHSETFAPVRFATSAIPGSLVTGRVTGADATSITLETA
ncbi:MAG: tRNA (N(6)-L-threonylcarbamoyladenosine(37)-C(2))-methylthiotransferase MtaB [Acidiphilium sp. 37-64-53]|uniref:tRNA (N(6)-L-threonylcarbamoyladenosine(37)-C(2))- methylthiotransferase MtaB n=1 Tax=Acidiphilium TaxID=522 RepID=UPI000BDB3333|nr:MULTISPECIES: tRNA (N(6)-L-threonylcarbamoyladenosine(37)-C(2))-methylthiotransferase MtaB [Acidiphilium]OYV99630.1 MAG: tRNA (N(6)-L-threonylcarbamoyladenosine(37)-C(2))-methylthiotransferase MtaB [Acidiphilium sp. 37-64-53]OZB21246.1 MAG: tRNA (N(6)-L-threonylcarbamoyladenosine(37)-C(2))-methylthiotransferase MtaB [Acidiphilium sp. 34-64-41]HQT86852.1 tRNA (N(6)-L-threonylcarbamoyladenosine(37)-C(2))-methylthiotransferase MtaB [Acidiphilium rubrum]